jgi:hypothetical protein
MSDLSRPAAHLAKKTARFKSTDTSATDSSIETMMTRLSTVEASLAQVKDIKVEIQNLKKFFIQTLGSQTGCQQPRQATLGKEGHDAGSSNAVHSKATGDGLCLDDAAVSSERGSPERQSGDIDKDPQKEPWGHLRKRKSPDSIRIGIVNVGGLPVDDDRKSPKMQEVCSYISHLKLDVVGLTECNAMWKNIPVHCRLQERTRGGGNLSTLIWHTMLSALRQHDQ